MKKNSAGFSLLELMIALGIIGIMTTALLAALDPLAQLQKGNDTKRKSDLALIQRALEEHYNDIGLYPSGNGTISGVNAPGWGVEWIVGATVYMKMLPKDPQFNAHKYYYRQVLGGQGYIIYASLERGNFDPQACNSGGPCASLSNNFSGTSPLPAADACGAGHTCNYAVSSSNVTP